MIIGSQRKKLVISSIKNEISDNMRLIQADQTSFQFRKSRKFDLKLLLMAAIEKCSACINLRTVMGDIKKFTKFALCTEK